jgi:hypothetical protein
MEFNIPMHRATDEIKSIYGKHILTRVTVRSNISGLVLKPGAMIAVRGFAKIMARMVMAPTIISSQT